LRNKAKKLFNFSSWSVDLHGAKPNWARRWVDERCRMRGATGTGPRTAEGLERSRQLVGNMDNTLPQPSWIKSVCASCWPESESS
jgi:hypothetical protein